MGGKWGSGEDSARSRKGESQPGWRQKQVLVSAEGHKGKRGRMQEKQRKGQGTRGSRSRRRRRVGEKRKGRRGERCKAGHWE